MGKALASGLPPVGSSNSQQLPHAIEKLISEFGSKPISSFDRMLARAIAQTAPQQSLKILRAMFMDALERWAHRYESFF